MKFRRPFARIAALALAVASTGVLTSFQQPGNATIRRNRVAAGTAGRPTNAIAGRLLYVWDNTLPGNGVLSTELFDLCRRRGVGSVAIDCAPLGFAPAANLARYRAFVDQARSRGITVLALAGDTWWTAPANAAIPGQAGSQSTGWDFYANVRASGVPFAGVLDVSEPYTRDPAGFWNDPVSFGQGLVDFLTGARARLGTMPLLHAMPYWYDQDPRLVVRLAGSSTARPLNQYVQPLLSMTVLLENRDRALGPDGILAHAQGELAFGPCILGVETQDLGPGNDSLTFWEEGRNAMERELALVRLAHLGNPNLRGFAVHHYGSFRQL